MWSWQHAWDSIPVLLEGFRITVFVTIVAFAIAAAVGLIVAVLRIALPRWLIFPISAMMEFVRLTPLVVQLLFVFYAVPPSISGIQVGIIVLGIHYSAYMAEVYRAGIEDVPTGQWEAARALSMSTSRTWRAVILPQAIRRIVPSLGNYAVSMFKDTPFLFVIFVAEMVTRAQQYGGQTFRYVEPITLAGIIFLIASLITAYFIRRLESHYDKQPG
ncbi:ectoine/hydroxyectoine ABC transporter permease subunit EhuD [Hoyosella rhizosphaerae]|uniref:Ectoine/hydroxyectoine ABC transporter permease subunit EhuD n=1 Tax=Hoyosella rhizosphaerae TaxID=1755582 RepID=A0A916U2E9_9ACTN|nr:ectoine/hydroxyectoine ABC transporter permease subunit EhuD [Hoyosella rhizosphaerae]MBN4926757.1 ectoine/hydroxyectoine ABC transporter permease subunit EhuD [Hoyosella rhizosphaerae]GGC56726.1 ectoine/hydroxyectoine ABC transporter permease subunit EhuD [Hoyosella rhizosphaerae]